MCLREQNEILLTPYIALLISGAAFRYDSPGCYADMMPVYVCGSNAAHDSALSALLFYNTIPLHAPNRCSAFSRGDFQLAD